MKEYLTMREAALLAGVTTKTVKNYIKRGVIRNYFLVEGKYGQEYKISVRDLEPLGFKNLEVLRDDFSIDDLEGKVGGNSPAASSSATPSRDEMVSGALFLERYDEAMVELGRLRERVETLTGEAKRLRQEIEEKDMLIQVLSRKGSPG